MKSTAKIALLVLICPARSFAQNPPTESPPAEEHVKQREDPIPTLRGWWLTASAGYSYFNLDLPGASRVGINGVDGALSIDFAPRLRLVADLGYDTRPNILSSGHSGSALTYMAGPVYQVMRGRRLDFHARSLVGGAKITGVFPGSTAVSSGFVNKLAWAFGGGIEYSLSVPFSVRTDVDYIHTAFFNPVGFVKGQNNVRVTTSLVYHFGVGR